MQPTEAPDAFATDDGAWGSAGYDASLPSESRAWERQSSESIQPAAVKPTINYAAPGSSSNSMNPASTVAFMLNMGYPPPPIALEPLRRLVEQVTSGHGNQLNVHNALYITDEITRSPYRIAPAVLFVVQQRLHSSKPDRVSLALELLDMCVKNCGLEFVRHINKEFMKSITSVVKTTSFKERTFTGQMKRLEKYITGAPSNVGMTTDPRVHKLRKMCLAMIQNWCEAFSKYSSQIAPILDAYEQLKRKGIQFPPKEANQRYMIRDASEPEQGAGQLESSPTWEEETVPRMEAFGNDPLDEKLPLTDRQFAQIESFVHILRHEIVGTQRMNDVLAKCESLRLVLEGAYRELNSRVQASSSRKLRCSNPAVTQLNALMSLDAEFKKKRGTRLLFEGTPLTTAAVSPAMAVPAAASPPAARKPVNLLDDLLDEDEKSSSVQHTSAGAAKAADEDDCFNTSVW